MYAVRTTVDDLRRVGLQGADLTGQGTRNRPRERAPLGVVTHTPSVTFARNVRARFVAEHGRQPTAVDLDVAAAARFDAATYQPNALIGLTGRVFLLDADSQRAQHSGMLAGECPAGDVYAAGTWWDWASPSDGSGWVRHGRPGRVVYDYWAAAFPGARSPLDIFPWGRYPNEALGVDLLPDPDTGLYNDAQRAAWVGLVKLWSGLHGFSIDLRHVTTHTLASPCERGTVRRNGRIVGVHWDPDAKVWNHGAMVAEAVR